MKKIYTLFLFLFVTGMALSQINIASSLTACYALNANANEPVNNLTGTVNAAVTPTVDRFSNANSAYSFNGTSSSTIQLPANALIKPSAISISMWAKTNIAGTIQILAFAWNGCTSYHEGYQLALINVGATYRFQAAKSTTNCSSGTQVSCNGTTTTLTANTWYHFGAYLGSDSIKVYVNGALNGTTANTLALNYANTNVILGGSGQATNFPFNGCMDNVRFYNRKLNGAEFNALYTNDPTCLTGLVPVSTFSQNAVSACVNQPIQLLDISSPMATAWSWTMTGGSPSVSAVANPTVSYPIPGVYTIALVASNNYGPSANTYTATVTISACTSVEENIMKLNKVNIYPQPAHDEISITGLPENTIVVLRNILGQTLTTSRVNNKTVNLRLSEYPNGIYFVSWTDGSQQFTKKVLKE